jgi:hypothetical protein
MNRHFTVVLVYLLTTSLAFAQSPSVGNAPKDPQASSIAQRSLAAMGSGSVTPNQTVQAAGTLTLHGTSDTAFPVILKSRGTQKLRTELTTSKGVRLSIVNTGHGIIRQPDGSVRQLSDANTLAQRVSHIPALSLLSEYPQNTVALEYLGNLVVDGSTVDIVAVSLYLGATVKDAQSSQGRTRTLYYIDSKTGLVNRIDQLNYAENDPTDTQKLQTHLSDYRLVNGVAVPFLQETYAEGQPLFTLALNSVTFGVTVSDSDFSLGQ